MIVTILHWLKKELIKGILQMMLLLLLINWLHLSLASALIEHPFLGWHGSASPTGGTASVSDTTDVFGQADAENTLLIIFAAHRNLLGIHFTSHTISLYLRRNPRYEIMISLADLIAINDQALLKGVHEQNKISYKLPTKVFISLTLSIQLPNIDLLFYGVDSIRHMLLY